MSSEVAIRCTGLSKRYRIGRQERYRALRDVITDAASSPFRRLRSAIGNANGNGNPQSAIRNPQAETIWALDDVSFEVKRGEVVGIIGRNGAGKSTLLKILSRITKPTKGTAEIHGRVGSLLEVGTGFHPELTGRENIYLNGAILGMRKAEIDRKFDEIVAFAEVEKFIDTPVKRYSSGMHVRLAFAVAAHMETEILLVDEVLAVGDAQFQKKCLGKMSEIGKHGRTIVFVSHNMPAIRKICSRGIVLSEGRTALSSTVEHAVMYYLNCIAESESQRISFGEMEAKPRFKSIALANDSYNYGEHLTLEAEIVSPNAAEVGLEVEIHDERGIPVIYTSTAPMGGELLSLRPGKVNRFKIGIGPLNLATGDYFIYFWLMKPWTENYHIVKQPLKFRIELSDPCNSGFDFRQSYSRGSLTMPITILDTSV